MYTTLYFSAWYQQSPLVAFNGLGALLLSNAMRCCPGLHSGTKIQNMFKNFKCFVTFKKSLHIGPKNNKYSKMLNDEKSLNFLNNVSVFSPLCTAEVNSWYKLLTSSSRTRSSCYIHIQQLHTSRCRPLYFVTLLKIPLTICGSPDKENSKILTRKIDYIFFRNNKL